MARRKLGLVEDALGCPLKIASDDGQARLAPYRVAVRENAGHGTHALRAAFNGLRYGVKADAP